MLLAREQLLECGDIEGLRAWCEMDELFGDDVGQVVEEGLGYRLDVLAAACRPPLEVHLEAIREPHCLKNCGVVLAELRECHLHLGDGPNQGGSSGSGPLVSFAGVVHLFLKSGLDRRLQRILPAT